MRPGSLRYIVQFLKPTNRVENHRAAARDWSLFAETRASIVAVSTTERAAFAGKQATATHTVTCRFIEGLTNAMRMKLPASGRTFEITDIRIDPTGQRRLTIKATEIVK